MQTMQNEEDVKAIILSTPLSSSHLAFWMWGFGVQHQQPMVEEDSQWAVRIGWLIPYYESQHAVSGKIRSIWFFFFLRNLSTSIGDVNTLQLLFYNSRQQKPTPFGFVYLKKFATYE